MSPWFISFVLEKFWIIHPEDIMPIRHCCSHWTTTESDFNLLSIIFWLHWSLSDCNLNHFNAQINEQPTACLRTQTSADLCQLSVRIWAQIFGSLPWALSVHTCLCVSATLRPVPQPPVQMTDWENQLACELMQKSSTDRVAGSQTHCCHGHTHTHMDRVGVRGSVRANPSSEPGYGEALIVALAKFQQAQSSKANHAHSQRLPCKEDKFLSTNFTWVGRKHFLRTPEPCAKKTQTALSCLTDAKKFIFST